MKELFNYDKLIKITVKKATASEYYEWEDEIKIFGIVFKKAGISSSLEYGFVSIADIPNHFLKDKVIYQKAYCHLQFQDSISKTYYADTLQEALDIALSIRRNTGKMLEVQS